MEPTLLTDETEIHPCVQYYFWAVDMKPLIDYN